MSSNTYKIIMVCVPYHFFNIPEQFLDFLLYNCAFCPKKNFPVYFLINKNKIEDFSPNHSNLFKSLKQKEIKKEKSEYDKKVTKYNLEKKEVSSKKEKSDASNYKLTSKHNDDNEQIEKINDRLVKDIINHITHINEFNEKKSLDTFLNNQEPQPASPKN
ncbi:hypothetical protein [Pectobacterium carotovorum]|uniref:hypothetical protein n=1 Tax=Pectobacterium carotovorum TaxID=554 RepID=UPI00103C489A|nr:hypothetical protein [Pectobacterium carotovorum]MBA0194596.1 hypothetical protein [Pectobacterium carotovorum]MBA0202660.1 hypothetical protein [Pectobacterium carotovorum]